MEDDKDNNMNGRPTIIASGYDRRTSRTPMTIQPKYESLQRCLARSGSDVVLIVKQGREKEEAGGCEDIEMR